MVLEKFKYLNSSIIHKPEPIEEPVLEVTPLVLPDNSVTVTLADQSPVSKSFVQVHKLADYRRKNSSILLVPVVDTVMDIFLFSREEVRKCIPTL